MTPTDLLFDGTAQGMYDTVARHLFTQGRPALDQTARPGEATCVYRGAEGTKCAIGVLIPDNRYDEGLEGSNAYNNHVLAAVGLDRDSDLTELAWDLQQAHDKPDNRDEHGDFDQVKLRAKLVQIAEKFSLNTDALPAPEVVS
jgi:hypothetical protein